MKIDSSGIDVTGTVTADGLTVDGTGTITNTSSGVATALSLKNNTAGANNRTAIDLFSANTKYVTLEGGYGASSPTFNLKVGNPPKLVMSADGNGDISFYEDTGTTAKLFWDASAESLGIGTSSPDYALHVSGGATNIAAVFESTDADTWVSLIDSNTTNNSTVMLGVETDDMIFRAGGAEYMRLDSSGNVGIGTDSPSSKLDVQQATAGNIVSAEFDNTDYTANNRNAIKIRQQISASGSYSAYLGSDKNTGNLFLANDSITADHFVINTSGNVGIGTDSPATNLHVEASGTNPYIRVTETGNTGIDFGQETNGNGLINLRDTADLRIFTAATERMRIDFSGNVLVGKSDTTFNTAGIALRSADVLQVTRSGDTALELNRTSNDGKLAEFYRSGVSVGSIGANGGRPYFASGGCGVKLGGSDFTPVTSAGATSDNVVNLGSATARFKDLYLSGFISGGSNVGATTRAVADGGVTGVQLQQARGSISSPATSAAGGDGSYITSSVYDGSAFNKIGQIGIVTGTSLDDGDIVFATAKAGSTTTKMTLDEDGNLLVGRSSISSTGNGHIIRGSDSAIFSRDASGETMQVGRNASAGDIVRFFSNGVDKGSINFDGTNTITYTSSSDQRLKENIVDAPSASDDIDAIQVRSFDWKADGSHQKYGMVAQELQSVAPEAVSGDADSDDMMGVDYSKLVPMLVKEIQSLRARVAQLEGAN
jgi:hypothetical protein